MAAHRLEAGKSANVEAAIRFLIGVMIFLIPLENVVGLFGGSNSTTGPMLVGLLTILLAAPYVVSGRAFRMPPASMLVIFAWVLWCASSLSWTISTESTLARVPTLVLVFGLLLLIWFFGQSRATLVAWMKALLWGVACSLVSLYYQFFTGKVSLVGEDRYSGAGMNENQLAGLFATAVFISYFLLSEPRGRGSRAAGLARSGALLALMVGASVGVLLTGSRSGTVCLAVSYLAVVLSQLQSRRWRSLAGWAFLSCAAGALIYGFVPQQLIERVTTGTEAHTFQLRMGFWIEGLSAWSAVPVFGIGYGCYPLVTTLGKVAHNTFVNVLVETGAVGCALLALFVFAIAVDAARRAPAEDRNFCLGLLLIWFVQQQAASQDYFKMTWLVYGLVVGMTYAARGKAEARP